MAASRATRAGFAIKRNQERNSRQTPYIEADNDQPRNPGLYGYGELPDVPKAPESPGSPDLAAWIEAKRRSAFVTAVESPAMKQPAVLIPAR